MIVLAVIAYVALAASFYAWSAAKASDMQALQEANAEIIYLFPQEATELKRAA